MVLPFRNNPKITTNWLNTETRKFSANKTKKSYYEISTVKVPGSLAILFREEKKRLGGSAEKARTWFGNLEFELDSTFARDLKMFLNEFVDADNDEVKNTVRLYFTQGQWCAKKGSGEMGRGDGVESALIDLSTTMSNSNTVNLNDKEITAEKR